ncbi:MAG: DNA-formamidopyrimidine glycosylase [Geminocystis sp.]|nr:DNA-formamidopyrimidine glycosylase [Geminocystis sp.]HIK38497.1 DNA-formamidopyrimidine glycosylase [Geminocystis sp. M7585_C2015_104]MCS7147550.1 DNA-formamidopyrimidine glycosylase [Geminocystis sp.]MCX8077953.1 DNA-formamidopyrimidine glycosylase [Geminocystis sp.]MDW8115243.1 DNA-formamidopyrimidine glycosylase [Geminocystis sp.]
MPELPEVETVCRGLNQKTSGLAIMGIEVLLPRILAHPKPPQLFQQQIMGQKILHWQRRGKYLLASLERGCLGIHLRMTGKLLWLSQTTPLSHHTRVRLFFPENNELRFVDTRTFGRWWYCPENTSLESIIPGLGKLGVEPLSPDFSSQYLQERFSKTNRPIKTLLLAQEIIAGIGNIYADEALFLSGIHPLTPASQLSPPRLKKLHAAIIQVLEKAIMEGGTTFSDFLNIHGVNGNYGGKAWVYRRQNQPCRICGNPIKKMKVGGRATYFCPQCQK